MHFNKLTPEMHYGMNALHFQVRRSKFKVVVGITCWKQLCKADAYSTRHLVSLVKLESSAFTLQMPFLSVLKYLKFLL